MIDNPCKARMKRVIIQARSVLFKLFESDYVWSFHLTNSMILNTD